MKPYTNEASTISNRKLWKDKTFDSWWCCEAWIYILWHLCSWPLFSYLLWGRQLFTIVGTHCVVRCLPWLHVLWFGDFFTRALMVVYQAMELDGNKRVQLVQWRDRAKRNFSFLCISINKMWLWIWRW